MSVLPLLFAAATSVRVLVPIVGSVVGANEVRWKTSVQLSNDTREEMFVALRLPTAPDSQAIAFTLPPGATQTFADVVNDAFGIDAALSPLLVETMGRRSVRVSASVYAISAAGVTKPEPIPIAYGDSTYPMRTLNGLSFSDAFRTNVGLVNLSDHDADFTLALQRISGRNIAVARLTIPPSSLTHTSIQSLFPLITKGDDFMVVVETGAPNTYVYGSVIDNSTSDARFVQPTIGAPDAQYGILTAHE